MKKNILLLVLFLSLISFIPKTKASTDTAYSYVLMDLDSGRVLKSKNKDTPLLIASITKIMTAIIAIENKDINDIVTVDEYVKKSYGSGIYISIGEEITLKDLLYGLMLRSGNDAAIMISTYISGSEESFVKLMNQKAKEIGMKNTIFYNSSGLDNNTKGNLSTAYDMALLTKYAMQNTTYKEIVKTKKYTTKTNLKNYILHNKKKMLNETAIKRLHAIKEFTALGSGYKIAMRDLSIRGSGDIFGSSQAGFVDTVGVSLYTKMIEDELKRVKGLPVEESKNEQSLININTHIDDSYVDDENIKIEIHQMINEIDSYDKLQQIKNVLEDRFGKITLEMEDYMYEEWFEKIAQKYNITQIRQTDRFIEIVLPEKLSSNVKGDKLLLNALSISRNFSFAFRHNQIIITLKYANLKEHFIRYIVRLLNTIN